MLNRDEQLVILRIERLDDKVEIVVLLLQLVDDDDELCVLDVNLQGALQVRVCFDEIDETDLHLV